MFKLSDVEYYVEYSADVDSSMLLIFQQLRTINSEIIKGEHYAEC